MPGGREETDLMDLKDIAERGDPKETWDLKASQAKLASSVKKEWRVFEDLQDTTAQKATWAFQAPEENLAPLGLRDLTATRDLPDDLDPLEDPVLLDSMQDPESRE